MAVNIEIGKIELEKRKKIISDLEVVPLANKNEKYNKKPIMVMSTARKKEVNYVNIPLGYAYQNNLVKERGEALLSYPPSSGYQFKGSLNQIQREVEEEALSIISHSKSILVALDCGMGKCLSPESKVLTWKGEIKTAEEISTDDLLIGDDSTPRRVLSVARGEEEMYIISQSQGESYTVNISHILTLKLCSHKRIKEDENGFYSLIINSGLNEARGNLKELTEYLQSVPNDNRVDIPLKKYLELPAYIKQELKGFKSSLELPEVSTLISPYIQGRSFNYQELASFPFNSNYKECIWNSKKTRREFLAGVIDTFGKVKDNKYLLPRHPLLKYTIDSLGIDTREEDNLIFRGEFPCRLKPRLSEEESCSDLELYNIGVGEYCGFEIDGNKRFLLEDFTVTHNTIFSLYLASCLGLKSLILCHRINIIEQWLHAIKKVCPDASSLFLKSGKKELIEDFVVMNINNLGKFAPNYFSAFGILIIDEAHTICTENISGLLLELYPRYLISLTATPERSDGLGEILNLFAGPYRIERKTWRPFNVYTYSTEFRPQCKKTRDGGLDWNTVLESQSTNKERNLLIVKMIQFFRNRNILVLCKRVEQSNTLTNILKSKKEDVSMYVSTAKSFDYQSRILVSTFSKTGVGFDHPKLDCLIIASDVQEGIEQYIGRVFRREDCAPIIIDIIDKMPVLLKHFKYRKEVYEKKGGEVKELLKCFPHF